MVRSLIGAVGCGLIGVSVGALLALEPTAPLRDGVPIIEGQPLVTANGPDLRAPIRRVRTIVEAGFRRAVLATGQRITGTWRRETTAHALQITAVLTPELRQAARALGGRHLGSLLPLTEDTFAVVSRNGHVFTYDVATLALRAQTVIPMVTATVDPGTGLRHIAVLSRTPTTLTLIAMMGRYESTPRACLRVGLQTGTLSVDGQTASALRPWWASPECVPQSAVSGAALAGRLLVTPDTVLVALGDGLAPHRPGSVFGALLAFPRAGGPATILSTGFRNPAGLAQIGEQVYVASQGPRGGDTLNVATLGADFGWPRVSYGTEYGVSGGYAVSGITPPGDVDDRVQPPSYVWVPGPAVSAMAVNQTAALDGWFANDGTGDLLVASLKGRGLYRCRRVPTTGAIAYCEPIVIGERLRDVVSLPSAVIVVADTGHLYRLARP